MPSATAKPSISLPIVDLSPYHDPHSTASSRAAASAALVSAFHTLGFVAVTNHGIPAPLLASAFATSKALFALPHASKMKAPHPPTPMPHRGYSAPGVEKVYSNAEASTADAHGGTEGGAGDKMREVRDYKESYEVGSDDPSAEQGNIWLPEDVLPGFRDEMLGFYWACNGAANVLLQAIADGLGLVEGDGTSKEEERKALLGLNSQHDNQLRLLHYPEVEAGKLTAQVLARMPAHTDWGTCTMLFQDGVGGLELKDPESGEWVEAVPVEGACVVNVGDFLERVTNGHFKSATHRVTLPPSQNDGKLAERYSIPYFIGPRSTTVGKCLASLVTDERPAKYDPLTFAEYATWRAKYSY